MGAAASTAYRLGEGTSGVTGAQGVAAGIGGVARAGASAAAQNGRAQLDSAGEALSDNARAGRQAAWRATGGRAPGPLSSAASPSSNDGAPSAPDWARRLRAEQSARHTAQLATQAVKDGDRPGAPANPDLDQEEN
jgi:type IV secretion system protein TrbL